MNALPNLIEEIYRIGWRATLTRAQMLASGLTGIDRRLRPICRLDDEKALFSGMQIPSDAEQLRQWWLNRVKPAFISSRSIKAFYQQHLSKKKRDALIERGKQAAKGRILAFRKTALDYGSPPDWTFDPHHQVHWPKHIHSCRTMGNAPKSSKRDIKFIWEAARFVHFSDIVRAWCICGEPWLTDRLFEQIASFSEENPLYSGPQWVSEQEVGIRAAMLTFVLLALDGHPALSGDRIQMVLRLLCACAHYCEKEIDFARHCVNNNHLIGGAMGIYLPAVLLPEHPCARRWKKLGRSILLACLKNQWYTDGGYTQPSHNYHRLALSFFLWVLRVAETTGDTDLESAVVERFKKPHILLSAMVDPETGRLPNWGPNDGAHFLPWTECDFADFRPLLNALCYAVYGRRQFPHGPWDEQLLWLWGDRALQADRWQDVIIPKRFPEAGLYVLEQPNTRAIFRCGSVRSRFGQQADQLHLDVWYHHENILHDPGSYSYHNDHYHEWFRSTMAHNTVVIDHKSQMKPYRRFLFLKWTRSKTIPLPPRPVNVNDWWMGWHNGYLQDNRGVHHCRMVADIGEDRFLVVDLLKNTGAKPDVPFDQLWHFKDGRDLRGPGQFGIDTPMGAYGIMWTPVAEAHAVRGDSKSPDGWLSRFYGQKTPGWSLHLTGHLKDQVVLAAVLGPYDTLSPPFIQARAGRLSTRDVEIDITLLWESAAKCINSW